MVVAGYFLGTYLDQRFSGEADYQVTTNELGDASVCVGSDGAWKNRSWPNVPALSPKCNDDG